MVNILILVFADTLVADSDEFFTVAECKGFLRTGLYTCRRLTVFEACIVTKDTFHDTGVKSAGIPEGRNVKWTGHHAGSAAYAY
jgi:hypothetical protein